MSASDPIAEWRRRVEAAPIPRSARDFARELEDELRLARDDELSAADLRERLRPGSGTDRRSRALRILDRLGWLDAAAEAAGGEADGGPSDQDPLAGSR